MLTRRNNTIQLVQGTSLHTASGYYVTAYPVGAQVVSVNTGTNTITVRAGHGITASDKFIVMSGDTMRDDSYRAVASVTATTVVYSGADITGLAADDYLVNLGVDTGTTSPNYDGSPVAIYTDMEGASTKIANSTVTTNTQGEYGYYSKATGSWELVRTSSGTPCELIVGSASSPFNICDFGAVGDNATDNAARIQACITAAGQFGGASHKGSTVRVPTGDYLISTPLVLPRGTGTPNNTVHLIGDDMAASVIKGTSGFPTNRGLIEWNSSATPAHFQRIENMRLIAPNVSGAMCIYYLPTLVDTAAHILAETIDITLRDLIVEANNDYSTRAIYLRGNVKLSSFVNIVGSFERSGGTTTSTYVIETDYTNLAGNNGLDDAGLNLCYLENIQAGSYRGGWGCWFKGRMNHCDWQAGSAGVGTYSLPYLDLNDSWSSQFHGLVTEGTGGQPQIKLTDCKLLHFVNLQVGHSSDVGGGVGNGIEMVSCTDCVFEGRATWAGAVAWSDVGKKFITLDANCTRNTFTGYQLDAANTSEIADSGTLNYFDGINIDTGVKYVQGADLLTNDLNATGGYRQTIDGWYMENVTTGLTDVVLSRLATTTLVPSGWYAPRAGSVTEMTLALSAAIVGGSMTVKAFKNGSALGMQIFCDSTSAQWRTVTAAKDAKAFAAGDYLEIRVTSDAFLNPTTIDIRASLELET